jgi:GH15 family glucan-1,4-alpha-glucosidase
MDLFERSIEIILKNQHASGAYVASPSFPTYRYCWFRDGAFIAYSMDLVGKTDSSKKFHAWAARAVNKRVDVVDRALQSASMGRPIGETEILHTRYTLEGKDGTREEWPNFQLDGFGTWLWALNEHRIRANESLPADWIQAVRVTASYLEAFWRQPCYDCWEEFSDKVHLHTLAAIYGGLRASQELDGKDRSTTLAEIKRCVLERGVANGHFTKFIGSDTVDASLLGVSIPYNLVSPDDPLMLATVNEIERLLMRGGGVHRYNNDTYYGGGEWVLLAGWLGWYYTEAGRHPEAKRMLNWMESTAYEGGNLPEQIPATLNNPDFYQPWINRWGKIAAPLLWSHANYLILNEKIYSTRL